MRTHGGAGLSANRLFQGDNVPVMQALLGEFGGRVDLIYLDPPFNTGQRRRSGSSAATYTDSWSGAAAYLRMLHPRMRLCRDLLGPTGSLILHLDWRSVHLARCVLDELFGRGEADSPGEPGFRNEIIWGYGGGGRARNAYRRKHDTLLWYSRSDRWTFNPQYRPYTPGTLQRGLTAVKGPNYTLRPEGAALETWWTDAAVGKVLSPTAAENRGYPTQKPENLLERILIGHSQPGDLVADFFCGSGTTGAVAQCS